MKERDRAPPDTAFVPESPAVHLVRASPNHGPRLVRVAADCLVLHYTGMRDGRTALDRLCHPASNVSCHYLVEEDGTVVQLVPEARRAWHAGRAAWAGETDINSASIGIEIVNGGHDFGLPPFPPRQIEAVVALCRDIVGRLAIRPERVLAHSDVAPGRKRDPGERFPWAALSAAGIGAWASAGDRAGPTMRLGDERRDVLALQRKLARYGYGLAPTGRFDPETETVVTAFQRHFRPEYLDGQADPHIVALLEALLVRFPAAAVKPAPAPGRGRA